MSVVHYGLEKLQEIKVFHYDPSVKHLIVCIHGGAWRDPLNTYNDWETLASMANGKAVNVFGVNYRLSPEVKHPTHLKDVNAALEMIVRDYPSEKLGLVGHSVGATIALQMLDFENITGLPTQINVNKVYLLDGIYDIPDLVLEYPSYISFVGEAFSSDTEWRQATQVTNGSNISPIDIAIIYSEDDELLLERQTLKLTAVLDEQNVTYKYHHGHWGKHEEMYRNPSVCNMIIKNLIE